MEDKLKPNMNNLHPLKNKPYGGVFTSMDIRIAVEWLKKEIEGIYVDEPVLINKIDKAFASVMPKQEKFCTQCDNELISPQEMKQGICDNCKFYLNKGNLK